MAHEAPAAVAGEDAGGADAERTASGNETVTEAAAEAEHEAVAEPEPEVVAEPEAAESGRAGAVGAGDRAQSGRLARLAPHRWWLISVGALILSRAISTAVVAVAAVNWGRPVIGSQAPFVLFPGQAASGARSAFARWDSFWYLDAAQHGWPHHPVVTHFNTTGFFPALPLALRWVHAATGLDWTWTGIAVAAITEIGAVLAVALLARQVLDRRSAERATVLFCLFPGAYVFTLIYSEPLFLLAAAVCLLALLRRWWWLAGLAAALGGATRPTGVALIACCVWVAGREIWKRRAWGSLLAPLLAPLGLVGYLAFLAVRTGSAWSYVQTQDRAWHQQPTIEALYRQAVSAIHGHAVARVCLLLLALAIVGLVLLARQVRQGAVPSEWFVYSVVAILVTLASPNIGLRPRFALLAFPILLGLAVRLRGRAMIPAVALSALGLGVLSWTLPSYIP